MTDPVVEPTEGVNAPAGTAMVEVDLSPYDGIVTVRIEVGDRTVFDNAVNAAVESITRSVTGSGTEMVYIYINDQLMRSYPLTFTS